MALGCLSTLVVIVFSSCSAPAHIFSVAIVRVALVKYTPPLNLLVLSPDLRLLSPLYLRYLTLI